MYGGLFTLLKELKIENVIISKQSQISQNYKIFLKLTKEKNIRVREVKKGDKLFIEKNLYINILWPKEKSDITENVLNNNAIMAKLVCDNFSVLFTGDIEALAEKVILQTYKNNSKLLKATILKVAHHGSKTSSTLEFLKAVKPKYALIGVGKNNKFGHPNDITLENLDRINCKILRTDQSGEITITICEMEKNRKIRIKTQL